jgi:hypothetical protein
MVQVTLPTELERVAVEQARRAGKSPQDFVLGILRQSLLSPNSTPVTKQEWRQQLMMASVECGTSLSNEALSSDGLYD